MKVAAVQLRAGQNKKHNIENALSLTRRAIRRGAKFICLPEVFNYRGPLSKNGLLNNIKERIPGESTAPFQAMAREGNVYILAGSVFEKIDGSRKVYNTSVLISPDGKITAKYRKTNLFTARIGTKKISESRNFRAGKQTAMSSVAGFKTGLTICYDLRFPEIFRSYSRRGADIVCVPSSFTRTTGAAHWEILLRARAIENACFIVAPNQIGKDHRGVFSYGNSLIINPWGKVVARASAAKEEIIYAKILKNDMKYFKQILPGIRKK